MQSTAAAILDRCPLFAPMSAEGRQRLASIAVIRKFRKGQLVFHQEEACPGVFVVGTGLVRIFKTSAAGKEHVLHIVGPGGTFAEVAAVGGFNCPANAEAVAPTTCMLLPLDLFQEVLESDHQLCLKMLKGVAFWVRHLVGLMEDVVLRDAAGRIARYLLEVAPGSDGTVELPALKRHVASHLNLTSETFSRTFRRLVAAGLIADAGANRIRLLNRETLRLVAEGSFPRL